MLIKVVFIELQQNSHQPKTMSSLSLADQRMEISSDSLILRKCADPSCTLLPPRSIKHARYCSFHYPSEELNDGIL